MNSRGRTSGSKRAPVAPRQGVGQTTTRVDLRNRAGFTLIELLTVIAILAILATLLMATLSSAKRKAWQAVCTSNLHQIGIVLNLYLEDNSDRPTNLLALVTSKYLPSAQVLRCPADRPSLPAGAAGPTTAVTDAAGNLVPAPHVSYRDPLSWPEEQWKKLLLAQTQAGIAVCTWHNVAAAVPAASGNPASAPSGFVLRGQLDGIVVRRQVYPPASAGPVSASFTTPSQAANAGLSGNSGPASDPPWEYFSDDPR